MLSYLDAILTPIYFLLLLLWVIRWKKKYYKNSPLKKYIVPAFVLKSICCVLLALLFEYYYGYSDSNNYYSGGVEIFNAAKTNPLYSLELIFKSYDNCSYEAQQFSTHLGDPIYVAPIKNMYKITGFFGLFCFGSYIPIALVITLLSFMGTWKIFMVFVEEFPAHYKKIALTCLFAPSFVFWSTNIMKDPLSIYGLGLSVSALYKLMKGRVTLWVIFEMLLGAFFMLSFKSYLFYIFCVAGFWAVYVNLVTNPKIGYKVLIKMGMFFLLFIGMVVAFVKREAIGETFSNGFVNDVTSIQNVQKEMGGSVYVLPNVDDFSLFGIIRTYFNSLNVALFRPYLWEIPNIIAIANAAESFVVLLATFYLLFKTKFIGFFKAAFKNRILTFALTFTLLLAPLAGLVSFNFGTLVRYKTPVVPFYYTFLILLYYKTKDKKNATKV